MSSSVFFVAYEFQESKVDGVVKGSTLATIKNPVDIKSLHSAMIEFIQLACKNNNAVYISALNKIGEIEE